MPLIHKVLLFIYFMFQNQKITGIYKIQSRLKPSVFYIGSSVNIKARWKQHIHRLKAHRHENKKLQNHADKYGINDLQFTIIFSCQKPELISLEQAFLNMHQPTLNILKTCYPGSWQPSKLSTRQKIKQSWKHRPPISMFSRLFHRKV